MDMLPISVAIVGAAGLIGRRHVQHVLDDPTFKLNSIVDPTPGGVEMAKELGVSYFADLESLLSASETIPQAAIIATPSVLHKSQAVILVEKGIHVLIEKPLCNSSEEARELWEVSQRQGAGTIIVGFHRRFNPYIVQLRKFLYGSHLSAPTNTDASSVGRIVAFHGFWCTRKPASYFLEAPWRASSAKGGGVVMTNLSHELDLMRFLFGEVDRIYAQEGKRTRTNDVEETVSISLHFVDGIVGTFLLSDAGLSPHSFESATGENPNLAKHHEPIYTIIGHRGTVTFPDLTHWSAAKSDEEGDWRKPLRKSTSSLALPFDEVFATDKGPNAPFSVRLAHWARALQEKEPIGCTLRDGIVNMKLLDAVRESMSTGKQVTLEP